MRSFIISVIALIIAALLLGLAPKPTSAQSPGALTHWHLFLHYITPPSATSTMQVSTQAIKRYDDPAATRMNCDADGATLVYILNNPFHVTSGELITWTCGYF